MFMSSVIAFCFVQRYISLTIVTAFMFSFINLNYFRDPLLIVLHLSLPFYFFLTKQSGMGFAMVNKLHCLVDIIHFVIPSVCCVCLFSTSSFTTSFTSSSLWLVIHQLLHPLVGRSPPPSPFVRSYTTS